MEEIATTPGLSEIFRADWKKAARLYARFGTRRRNFDSESPYVGICRNVTRFAIPRGLLRTSERDRRHGRTQTARPPDTVLFSASVTRWMAIYFFEGPGAENTAKVVQAVKRRLRQNDINKVLVASESGKLALELGKTFAPVSVICVTYDPVTRRKYQKPALRKEELLKQGIIVVDTVPEPLTRSLTFRNWWEKETVHLPGPSADLFWMTLICVGGHGFRTAVEIVFVAVEAGVVRAGERVVSMAGTGWGADSAIVMTASRFEEAVGEDPKKRMKVEEILAMPKRTRWTGYG